MGKSNKTIVISVRILSFFSAAYLVFNMVAIVFFKNYIFFDHQNFSNIEIILLIGFIIVALFDILSFSWLLWSTDGYKKVPTYKKLSIALSVLCLFLLIGEKTMIDEIGREYEFGREMIGEWVILYIFLAIQLAYNFIIFRLSKAKTCN
ncbi:MAG: hypothetical protein PHX30_04765 [Candidatus Pacebacteria bacterium]|nr:hypothetical protein [Candidatus Paceibacterota bacterium]